MRRKHLDRDEVWRGESHVNSRLLIVGRVDKVLIEENGDVARHTSFTVEEAAVLDTARGN